MREDDLQDCYRLGRNGHSQTHQLPMGSVAIRSSRKTIDESAFGDQLLQIDEFLSPSARVE